ncbi:hypothetical protein PR048_007848 [Dryococelus australis]|uniref:Uncharacterized protein n=1 Tax=Dryococelus australis TaxID=614101 RepID=A0ABQ9HVE7_9NEOP|nr:hypothetical protein PR048_007848 [Dryococelus australis]
MFDGLMDRKKVSLRLVEDRVTDGLTDDTDEPELVRYPPGVLLVQSWHQDHVRRDVTAVFLRVELHRGKRESTEKTVPANSKILPVPHIRKCETALLEIGYVLPWRCFSYLHRPADQTSSEAVGEEEKEVEDFHSRNNEDSSSPFLRKELQRVMINVIPPLRYRSMSTLLHSLRCQSRHCSSTPRCWWCHLPLMRETNWRHPETLLRRSPRRSLELRTSPGCARRFACRALQQGAKFELAALPDSRKRKSCRTMPLVGEFSRRSPASPTPCIAALLHSRLIPPSSTLNTSLLRDTQISQLNSIPTVIRTYKICVKPSASMEQRRNEGAVETGDPRENAPTRGIVRHDSRMRKSGRPGIEPGWSTTESDVTCIQWRNNSRWARDVLHTAERGRRATVDCLGSVGGDISRCTTGSTTGHLVSSTSGCRRAWARPYFLWTTLDRTRSLELNNLQFTQRGFRITGPLLPVQGKVVDDKDKWKAKEVCELDVKRYAMRMRWKMAGMKVGDKREHAERTRRSPAASTKFPACQHDSNNQTRIADARDCVKLLQKDQQHKSPPLASYCGHPTKTTRRYRPTRGAARPLSNFGQPRGKVKNGRAKSPKTAHLDSTDFGIMFKAAVDTRTEDAEVSTGAVTGSRVVTSIGVASYSATNLGSTTPPTNLVCECVKAYTSVLLCERNGVETHRHYFRNTIVAKTIEYD